MKNILFALLTLLISSTAFSQMQYFPQQNPGKSCKASCLFSAADNNLLYFWIQGSTLYKSKSTDNGITWGTPAHLIDTLINHGSTPDINCFSTASGRILLLFKSASYYIIYSDNNGESWSYPTILLTGASWYLTMFSCNGNFAQSASGRIFLIYNENDDVTGLVKNVSCISSTNNGVSWSPYTILLVGPSYGSIIPSDGLNLSLYYQDNGIYSLSSTDEGVSWQNPVHVLTDTGVSSTHALKDPSGKIWLFYLKNIASPFINISQPDIFYITSSNNGSTWSPESGFTKFKGIDKFFSLSSWGNNPLVSFLSNRNKISNDQLNIWYGIAGITNDNDSPPYIYQYKLSNPNPPANTPVKFTLYIDNNSPIASSEIIRTLDGSAIAPIALHDDGLQEDSVANDKIYSAMVPGINMGDILSTSFKIQDQSGQIINYLGPDLAVPMSGFSTTNRIYVNNFDFPIGNNGVLGDVVINGASGGAKLDGKVVLFSGGFYMSGFSNGLLWANGMASAANIYDYVPGKVGSSPVDPKNVIYVVSTYDPDFGQSWMNWSVPVSMGAGFYDGNHDNLYNPVDLNSNGKWDPDEDRPANMGDYTAWCVYNDGLASNLRWFADVDPQGIEIQQTVFAKNTSQGNLANVIFVKYHIANMGTVSNVLDSVYFSPSADADIGDYGNYDLDGCDTLLNTGYTYHSPVNPDSKFGNNPPALFMAELQGPQSYIPGVTFTDLNSNGIYDDGIDFPLDTAYSRNGIAGIKEYPGAKNLGLSSFIQYYNGIDPANKNQARFYNLGKNNIGSYFNPCTLTQGTVLGGINCSSVNPLFMYSGDPVSSIGWINKTAKDQRFISNYGPFQLIKNKPVNIIVAYVVGRGTDALNSISVAKGITKSAIDYYSGNFDWGTTSVNDKNNPLLKSYSLDQNYPNPFNPNTVIKYSLPVDSHIKLTIYNTIGQVVKTLVNEIQSIGSHSINFNASSLSSGVYFYSIQSNSIDGKQNYSNTKKMILLK